MVIVGKQFYMNFLKSLWALLASDKDPRKEILEQCYNPRNFTPDKVGICPICVAEGRCSGSDEYMAYINRHPVGTLLKCVKCGNGFTGMNL